MTTIFDYSKFAAVGDIRPPERIGYPGYPVDCPRNYPSNWPKKCPRCGTSYIRYVYWEKCTDGAKVLNSCKCLECYTSIELERIY